MLRQRLALFFLAAVIISNVSYSIGAPVALYNVAWRWMSGSQATNVYGSTKPMSPGSRSGAALTSATVKHSIYLAGGYGYIVDSPQSTTTSGPLGDVWSYTQSDWGSQGQWKWEAGFSNTLAFGGKYEDTNDAYMGARTFGIAFCTVSSHLYLQGGLGYDGNGDVGYLNDLWQLDLSTSPAVWKWIKGSSVHGSRGNMGTIGQFGADNVPGSVGFHSLLTVYPGSNENSYNAMIFGGNGYVPGTSKDGLLSDVWLYSTSKNEWKWLNGPGKIDERSVAGGIEKFGASHHPGSRKMFGVADTSPRGSDSDYIYILGGKGFSSSTADPAQELADLWAFSVAKSQWAYIRGESAKGGSHAPGFYGTSVVGYPGIFGSTLKPGARSDFGGWADPNSESRLIYFFGGTGYDATSVQPGLLNDFWAYDPVSGNWAWAGGSSVQFGFGKYLNSQWFSSKNVPGSRRSVSVACDRDTTVMYLFGGNGRGAPGNIDGLLNDLWATRGPMVYVENVSPTPSTPPTPLPPIPAVGAVQFRWLSGYSGVSSSGKKGVKGQFSTDFAPSARLAASMVSASSVNENGHVFSYLFGGQGVTYVHNDMWCFYQNANGEALWSWLGGNDDGEDSYARYSDSDTQTPIPGGREDAVIWYSSSDTDTETGNKQYVHIFGGVGFDGLHSEGYLNDIWRFDVKNFKWKWVSGSSIKDSKSEYQVHPHPGGIGYHMRLKYDDDTMYIYGGNGFDSTSSAVGLLADTWKYSVKASTWAWINGPSAKNQAGVAGAKGMFDRMYFPGSRSASAVATVNSNFDSKCYLFGGAGYSVAGSVGNMADLWVFDQLKKQWAYLSGENVGIGPQAMGSYGTRGIYSPSNAPSCRSRSKAWIDGNANKDDGELISIYGGYGLSSIPTIGHLNDYWVFNRSDALWVWVDGSHEPNTPGEYSDRWYSTKNTPGGRNSHSLIVDEVNNDVFVFGGWGMSLKKDEDPGSVGSQQGALNDLWTTKGCFVHVPPITPPPRFPSPSKKPPPADTVATPPAVPNPGVTVSAGMVILGVGIGIVSVVLGVLLFSRRARHSIGRMVATLKIRVGVGSRRREAYSLSRDL